MKWQAYCEYLKALPLNQLECDLREELQDKLHEKQLREKAWMEAKRQISFYRAQIRALLGEAWQLAEAGRGAIAADTLTAYQLEAESIAGPIRTYMALDALRELQRAHKALYANLKALLPQDAPCEITRAGVATYFA